MASKAGSRGKTTRKETKKKPATAATRTTTSRSTSKSASLSTSAPARKAKLTARTKKNLRRAGAVVAGAAAAAAVGTVIKKVVRKVASRKKAKATAARPAIKSRKKVEPDIPMDRIASTYTPTQTSLKGPFRTTGADRQRDQEYARGVNDDERFRDEDVYTNKSGDPRIGTHGRTYEPKEKSGGSRSDENR